jgi:hypothetical protein
MTGSLVGVAIAVVIVLGACVLAGRGAVVDATVADGRLTVRPRGARWLLALRRSVTVPVRAVTAVEVVDPKTVRLGIRMPGTSVPGLLNAGSYGTGDARTFAFVARARRVLLVHVEDGPYRRLLVQVPEPNAVAATIEAAHVAT